MCNPPCAGQRLDFDAGDFDGRAIYWRRWAVSAPRGRPDARSRCANCSLIRIAAGPDPANGRPSFADAIQPGHRRGLQRNAHRYAGRHSGWGMRDRRCVGSIARECLRREIRLQCPRVASVLVCAYHGIPQRSVPAGLGVFIPIGPTRQRGETHSGQWESGKGQAGRRSRHAREERIPG